MPLCVPVFIELSSSNTLPPVYTVKVRNDLRVPIEHVKLRIEASDIGATLGPCCFISDNVRKATSDGNTLQFTYNAPICHKSPAVIQFQCALCLSDDNTNGTTTLRAYIDNFRTQCCQSRKRSTAQINDNVEGFCFPFESNELRKVAESTILTSIHGIVFNDQKATGEYNVDAGDEPLGGVTIGLNGVDCNGNTVVQRSATSDKTTGQFWFTNLLPGNYVLNVVQDAFSETFRFLTTNNSEFEVSLESGQEKVFSAGMAGQLKTGQIEVVDSSLAFGFSFYGSIHGVLYENCNNNGLLNQNDSNRRVQGAKVLLETTNIELETTTNANGEFWFSCLKPIAEAITISVESPEGYNPKFVEAVLSDGLCSGQELVAFAGQAGLNLPKDPRVEKVEPDLAFVIKPSSSLHGLVYFDANGNTIYDNTSLASVSECPNPPTTVDVSLSDVRVDLYQKQPDGTFAVTTNTQTTENGLFSFENLSQGSYFALPISGITKCKIATRTFSQQQQIVAPDAQQSVPYPSELTVDSSESRIVSASLTLKTKSNSLVTGLQILLEAPRPCTIDAQSETDVERASRIVYIVCSNSPNDTTTLDGCYTFDSNATNSITQQQGVVPSGTYKPCENDTAGWDGPQTNGAPSDIVQYTGNFFKLNTFDANGTWKLWVYFDTQDEREPFVIDSWSLNLQLVPCFDIKCGRELVALNGQSSPPDGVPVNNLDPRKEVQNDALKLPFIQCGRIQGVAFFDANGNGVFDTDQESKQKDAILAQVDIRLTGTDGYGNKVDRTTTTDDSGQFSFEDLQPSVEGQGDGTGYTLFCSPSLSNDNNVTTVPLQPISLYAGETVITNVGCTRSGSLHGLVFENKDKDPVFSPVEDERLAGAKVTLTGTPNFPGSTPINPQVVETVENSGQFWFRGLLPGMYTVTVQRPPNSTLAPEQQSQQFEVFAGIALVAEAGQSDNTSNETECVDTLLGFPLSVPGTISGTVMELPKAGEEKQVFVGFIGTVQLFPESSTQFVAEVQVDSSNGQYTFASVSSGTYTIQIVPQTPEQTGDVICFTEPTGDSIVDVCVEPGEDVVEQDFCAFVKGSIHGIVVNTCNQNSTPLDNAEIQLQNSNQETVQTVTTEENGLFSFENLIPDTYNLIQTSAPQGYIAATDVTDICVKSRQELVYEAGAAMIPEGSLRMETQPMETLTIQNERAFASLHGSVFTDANGNGSKGDTEEPLTNPESNWELVDSNNAAVAARTTDGNGLFEISAIDTCTFTSPYTLTITAPENYVTWREVASNDEPVSVSGTNFEELRTLVISGESQSPLSQHKQVRKVQLILRNFTFNIVNNSTSVRLIHEDSGTVRSAPIEQQLTPKDVLFTFDSEFDGVSGLGNWTVQTVTNVDDIAFTSCSIVVDFGQTCRIFDLLAGQERFSTCAGEPNLTEGQFSTVDETLDFGVLQPTSVEFSIVDIDGNSPGVDDGTLVGPLMGDTGRSTDVALETVPVAANNEAKVTFSCLWPTSTGYIVTGPCKNGGNFAGEVQPLLSGQNKQVTAQCETNE